MDSGKLTIEIKIDTSKISMALRALEGNMFNQLFESEELETILNINSISLPGDQEE